ncbi:DUF6479 family protein [Streptacidiphilus griseoplanus]|uniref:DUF6479 family protein n=1 Tax=Peterkaempfera griseoplana TaxID=66896 RepID=UPI0012FF5ACB|nr:DUF6479 family protein [Peterkaempfera griseoplana]
MPVEAVVVSDVTPAVVAVVVIGVLLVVALVAAFIVGYRRKQDEPPPPVSHGPGSESWGTREQRQQEQHLEPRPEEHTGGHHRRQPRGPAH